MKNLYLLLLFIALVLIMLGCNKDNETVPADKIYQIYYYEYLAYEDQTFARASFRENDIAGKLVKLNDEASIEVNGTEMPYNEQSGSFPYALSYNGNPASLEFVYSNRDGKQFTNTVYRASIDSISFLATNHTTSFVEDYILHWDGPAVGPNERVILNIRTQEEGSEFITIEQTTEGATTLTISKHDLLQLTNGEHQMYLHRYKDMEPQDVSAVGGLIVLTYSSGKAYLIVE